MHLPVTGQPLHTRSLTVILTLGEGGRWHARGNVIDIRKTGFAAMSTSLQPAGLIHSMTIDLELAADTLCIEKIETRQDAVAVEPSTRSGGECCRDPAANLQALVGDEIDAGFSKRLSLTFGGARGCSHLLALFFFMAAAVARAAEFERERAGARGEGRDVGECMFQRSFSLDGLEAADGGVEISVQIGDYHFRPERLAKDSVGRLEHEHDIRLAAKVQASDQTLSRLAAIERRRDSQSLATAEWCERPDWGESLVGLPLLSGFAARVMQTCGTDPEQHLLLDTLLQLAPGHFQVLAAFADRWAASSSGDGDGDDGPGVNMSANCYMWRPGGGLDPDRDASG